MRPRLAALALCAMVAVAGAARSECQPNAVEFNTAAGPVRFRVEVASTATERARGLMERRRLADSSGMLFVFPKPVRAQFWMKDTRIPLDMIFIDPAGRVTRVKAHARPMDATIIDGGPNVRFVLEINAGLAGRLGIRRGSVMRSPLVPQAIAAWRCDAS